MLRHKPEKIGQQLDEQGWVKIDALLQALPFSLSREAVADLVRDTVEQRFAFSADGLMIRAKQGPGSIFAQGPLKATWHHVHLSATVEIARAVGARRGQPVLLSVAATRMAAAAQVFYRAQNGVWLTDIVPQPFLSRMQPKHGRPSTATARRVRPPQRPPFPQS